MSAPSSCPTSRRPDWFTPSRIFSGFPLEWVTIGATHGFRSRATSDEPDYKEESRSISRMLERRDGLCRGPLRRQQGLAALGAFCGRDASRCLAAASAAREVSDSRACALVDEDAGTSFCSGGRYQILIFVILWKEPPGTLPKYHLSMVTLVAGAPSVGTYSNVTLLSPVQIRSTP